MEASALPRPKPLARWPGARLRGADDADLVQRVRAGDESAFEVAYDRHHRGILSFCRHMLGSQEEAEDAVQHTFIAAYRDLVGSDKRIQLKPWLYTIARNRCLSVLRARREQVALDDVEPATEGLSSQVQRRQDLREMLADLAALPEDQREALVLAEIGALSHEEIAVTLGVRKDKVKALVFQARESLSSSRQARDADCQEIQEQIAVLRGGSLRRTTLRRHVERCPACAAYKAEVQRQRAAMAAILPVVPTVALKQSVLAGVFATGAPAAAGAGAGTAATGGAIATTAKGLASKALLVVAVGGGATGAGVVLDEQLGGEPPAAIAEGPARIAPDTPLTRQRDRGVAPVDGQAVPVVASLRGRATETAAQREADRTGATTATAPGGGEAPPPLNPSAVVPAVVGGEVVAAEAEREGATDEEKADKAKDKGQKDRGNGNGKAKGKGKRADKGDRGQANGHKKHGDGDKDHGAGAKDRGNGGNGRADGPPPGQAKKDRGPSAPAVPGTGRKAPKKPAVGGRKHAAPTAPSGGKVKGAKPGKSRVPKAPKPKGPQAPPAPAAPPQQPAPAPGPPSPSREPAPTTPEKLVDGVKGTVDSVVKPREDKGNEDKQPRGVVDKAKGAVKGAMLRLLPF